MYVDCFFFFFQAEDGIRDVAVTGVQTCALPICSSCSLVCCSSLCCACNSAASCCDCLSSPSVCMVASMLLTTMPILVVSCSRNIICSVVNSPSEASSITALTWLSNSTGSTTTLRGTALNSADPIGTASVGISV